MIYDNTPRVVDHSNKGLYEVPSSIFKQASINWLFLSNNLLYKIPSDLKSLKRLTRLALNDNRISEIEVGLGDLSNLTWIDLTRNNLTLLPVDWFKLTKITGFGLSENLFETIPECVYYMIELKKFGFFCNRISSMSPKIGNLINLVKLDLSNNFLEVLPNEICKLRKLTWLNLSCNKLERLPHDLRKLTNLEELGLGNNCLIELPDLKGLLHLRILPIFKNKINKITGIKDLNNLEKLDLSDNCFVTFPYEALHVKNLNYLNLKKNFIEELDFENFSMPIISRLSVLDLSQNKLTSLPAKIFNILPKSINLRIHKNPFLQLYNEYPKEPPSLLGLCFSRLSEKKKDFTNKWWICMKFEEKMKICDNCNSLFVNEPFIKYEEMKGGPISDYVIKKYLCSYKCIKK